MGLKQQLTEDMKQAMRDRDSLKLGTIRYALSELKNVEIDQGELDDAEIQKVMARMVKQLKDAIYEFEAADRLDLVEEEGKKVAVLESYLPAQLSDTDLEKIVQEAIDAMPDAQMGQIIGAVMKKAEGQADGGRVSAKVKELLG